MNNSRYDHADDPNSILNLDSVTMGYGNRIVIDNISFSLKRGIGIGLLGVNGAGKTTILDLIMGLQNPWKGTVKVFGVRPQSPSALKQIGFAPEDGIPLEEFTALEYLSFVGALKQIKAVKTEVTELLEWFELPKVSRIAGFSKGMIRRLILAQCFLGRPNLLILDEPLNGLDAIFIAKLRTRLITHIKEGGSLILASHIIGEIERVCSHIAILGNGKLLRLDETETLIAEYGSIETAFSTEIALQKKI